MKLVFLGNISFDSGGSLLPELVEFVREGDYSIATLRALPDIKNFDHIIASGINHFNMATPEVTAHGYCPLFSSQFYLKHHNIDYSGAGATAECADAMCITRVGDRTLGILSISTINFDYTANTDSPGLSAYDIDFPGRLIKRVEVAAKEVDFLVLNIEWDLSQSLTKIRRVCRNLIKAGAKIINGVEQTDDLSDCPQPEIINGAVVIYNTGSVNAGSVTAGRTQGVAIQVEVDYRVTPYDVKHWWDYLWFLTGYNETKIIYRIVSQSIGKKKE